MYVAMHVYEHLGYLWNVIMNFNRKWLTSYYIKSTELRSAFTGFLVWFFSPHITLLAHMKSYNIMKSCST